MQVHTHTHTHTRTMYPHMILDYNLLCVMLTSRALSSHKKLFGGSSALTRDDWNAVKDTFNRFDEVMAILRLLPTSMILVLRNINIVRSVNRELGSPVNRFNIMSKRYVILQHLKEYVSIIVCLVQCYPWFSAHH